ncbi:hypothetical protein LOTGIDRAFT_174442 [Lottia gigantea]|uniref:Uncharacterized protein n=1 Tax=Lottia gigantea TaxID=225164 RepID=V4A2F1_LOTGI|nr:hypothetical protein LOTGIDRAFT_174442 [Lottia gigantea]ESO98038.1 hypothetical protein LOTGIDRAFT_174442 [Lottia gigantea]
MVLTNLPFERNSLLQSRYHLIQRPDSAPIVTKSIRQSGEHVENEKGKQAKNYASFLKEQERKVCPDGFVDSGRYSYTYQRKKDNPLRSSSSPRIDLITFHRNAEEDGTKHEKCLKVIEPGTHDKSHFKYSGSDNYTLEDGKYQALARYDLNPDKPMDGIIYFDQEIKIANYITLEIRKRYTVFPKGQEDSTYFLNNAIVGQAHKQGALQANLPHAFFISIFGAPTDISIRKNLKTRLSYDFPGFEFLITRYFKGQVSVVLTSYNVTVEDSGTYEIIANFEGGRFMKYSFEVYVVNNIIRIDSFSRTESHDENGKRTMEVTCTATGDPLPTVYFIHPVPDENSPVYTFREIKLENNGTFEIKPSEVTGDSVTRKMIVYKLLESIYFYEIGCKAISKKQERLCLYYHKRSFAIVTSFLQIHLCPEFYELDS